MSPTLEKQARTISSKKTSTASADSRTEDKFKNLKLVDANTESTLRSGKITTASDFEKVNKLATSIYKLMAQNKS